MKKAIFTVLLGGYDNEPMPTKIKGWDNVIFTDQRLLLAKKWEKIIKVAPTDNPALESRRYKWLSHKFIPEYDLVCYHDANMRIIKILPDYPFRIVHYKRKTVQEEADACNKQVHRCTVESINYQMNAYRTDGFTDQKPLYLNGFFSRLHNEKENHLHEYVFSLLEKYTPRDQLALPYAMWKCNNFPDNERDGMFYRQHIRLMGHKILKPKIFGVKNEGQTVNVHHITPGRSDKNFGKAINDIVRLLPDSDWICLRDIDTIPPHHEIFFKQCEEIAKSNGYGLVGCITNRLGLKWQLHKGEFSEDMDMMNHKNIAMELSEKYGNEVKPCMSSIGGLFMLFPKSTWNKVGGFPEGAIMIKGSFIDYHFWESVRKKGIKVGIAKGIYLFHSYRMGKDRKNKNHLI